MLSLSAALFLVRSTLLVFGILALLGATVLFDLLVRRPLRAWLRLTERLARKPTPIPRPLGVILRSEPLLRAWQGFCAVVFLALSWYLGTAAGAARWAALASQAPR